MTEQESQQNHASKKTNGQQIIKDDLRQWGNDHSDDETADIQQMAQQIHREYTKSAVEDALNNPRPETGLNEQEGQNLMKVDKGVDKGTQDYSGYFGGDLYMQRFDLVPRVDSQAIQNRNADLVKQALNTRHLMAIPKSKIKTKKVSNAQVKQAIKRKINQEISLPNDKRNLVSPLTEDFYDSVLDDASSLNVVGSANEKFLSKTITVATSDDHQTQKSLNLMSILATQTKPLQERETGKILKKVPGADLSQLEPILKQNQANVLWNEKPSMQTNLTQNISRPIKEMTFQNGFPLTQEQQQTYETRVETLALNTNTATDNNSPVKAMILGSRNSMTQIGARTFGYSRQQIHNTISVSQQSQTQFTNDTLKISNTPSIRKPPQTAAEQAKTEAIRSYLLQKHMSKNKTMQERTTQKIGPGSYLKDANLNMIGSHKTSNSVKGFGNGFLSKADRGLETSVVVVKSSPTRSLSVSRKVMSNLIGQDNNLGDIKMPIVKPNAVRENKTVVDKKTIKQSIRLPTYIGKSSSMAKLPDKSEWQKKLYELSRDGQMNQSYEKKTAGLRVCQSSMNFTQTNIKRIRINPRKDNGPGPGSYDDQKQAIHHAVDEFVKKNAIVAKKVEINQKLRSKLSFIVKANKTTTALGNSDLDLDDTPLIQIYERLKKEGDKQPIPFESPDISLTKERSQCATISHQKYANPLSNSVMKMMDQTQKLQQSQLNNLKKPPRPSTIPDSVIKHIDRFITNKATIADNRSSKVQGGLGDDLDFQPTPTKQNVGTASLDSTQFLDDDSLSSRMLTHNTLAHKLEIMKRNSKRSAVFHRKANASILSPDQPNSFPQKLITTPSIPMPERFYYEQNPKLLESKIKTLVDKRRLNQSVSVTSMQNVPFSSFKRVSSLDHLQLLAKSNAAKTMQVRESLQSADLDQERAERLAQVRKQNQENANVLRPASMNQPGPMDYQPINTKSMVATDIELQQRIHNNHQDNWL